MSLDHKLQLKVVAHSLGADVIPVNLESIEGLSRHFEIWVTVLLNSNEVNILKKLGSKMTVAVMLAEQEVRRFDGLVAQGEYVKDVFGYNADAPFERMHVYRLKLSPKAAFHDQGRNFRIFQDKTVEQIVTTVLNDCGITFKFKADGGRRKRAYCVQYKESDFAFVSRLLEEHGLFYFYDHDGSDGHSLTICDDVRQLGNATIAELTYNPEAASIALGDRLLAENEQFLYDFKERGCSSAIGKVTFRDFDFKRPTAARQVLSEGDAHHQSEKIEFYDWPGRYYVEHEGNELSKVYLEADQTERLSYAGEAISCGIIPGHKIKVSEHPASRLNGNYVALSSVTQIADQSYRSATGEGETKSTFVAVPENTKIRAPLTTPRPQVQGLETAIVTGPESEEIHVDEHGRVKVHFHWDRIGAVDDTSSCWIRVSQTGGLGNIIHPRVGQEVLVDFINGDPDRPIIVGRVYNEEFKPHHALPDNKTKAVWKTKTYKKTEGASYSDARSLEIPAVAYNELYFDDATDAEEIFLHAEKDLNVEVRHFETRKVGGNVEIEIGKNRKEIVWENEDINIKKSRKELVEENENIEIKKNRDEKVGGNENIKIDGKQEIDVGDSILIKAGSKITLQCGGSTIEMTPMKITISTTQFEATGSAQAALKSGGKTDVNAGGLVSVSAPMVKIN